MIEDADHDWTSYADSLSVVIRELDYYERGSYERAVLASFGETGESIPLEDFTPELHRWLAEQRGDHFSIETRRTYVSAGAWGAGAQLVVTIFGTAGGMALYYGLLALVKQRLLSSPDPRGTPERGWFRSIDADFAGDYLAGTLARAIECRRSDLALIELVRAENDVRATYDIGDDRYEIRVGDDAYSITRLERAPERGADAAEDPPS